MSQISTNSALGTYATDYQYRTEKSKTSSTEKKTTTYGKTIGNAELSETAAKYYEELKAKYSNMDFILVSSDLKDTVEKNAASYASGSDKELVVLIDADKIEQMAADEDYRAKYEGILDNATSQLNQMWDQLGLNADKVKSFGVSFDDDGNASFFAVVDKSLAKQRERIDAKREQKLEDQKKTAKEERQERLEKQREKFQTDDLKGKGQEPPVGKPQDLAVVSSSSWEGLLKEINNAIYSERADSVRTEAELAVGGNIDYSA